MRNKRNGFIAFLITQFLGAFNDNTFRLVISLIALESLVTKTGGTEYLSLVGAIFILPFILFSMYAGYFADKVSKKKIIIYVKVAEFIIMSLGLIAFILDNIWYLYIVLFLMGAQSAVFGPSKYGIIPEILEEKEISWGNGIVGMLTYLAIILGTASAGFLKGIIGEQLYIIGLILVGISFTGIVSSFFITPVSSAGSTEAFKFNFLKHILEVLKKIRRKKRLLLAIIGSVYFAFISGLYQLNILLYSKNFMGAGGFKTGLIFTVIALGIGIGSFLAGKLSGEKIEFGLIPLGAIGVGLFSILLGITQASFIVSGVYIFLLGFFAGFFFIPIISYIQEGSPLKIRGEILGVNSFLNFSAIFVASGLLWFLREIINFTSADIFVIFGIITFFIVLYILMFLPTISTRLILWIITHTVYRLRVKQKEIVPKEENIFLTCNLHDSLLELFFIIYSFSRPVELFLFKKKKRLGFFTNLLLKLSNAKEIKNISQFDAEIKSKKNKIVCVVSNKKKEMRKICKRKELIPYTIIPVEINTAVRKIKVLHKTICCLKEVQITFLKKAYNFYGN